MHFLGAPNVINCLYPHISKNRRFRIFLEHDNDLTVGHVLRCAWQDATVLLNWTAVASAGSQMLASASALAAIEYKIAGNTFINVASKCEVFAAKTETYLKIALFWLPAHYTMATSTQLLLLQNIVLLNGNEALQYLLLLRQHSLKNMLDSFEPNTGYPSKCVRMNDWPTLSSLGCQLG
jgi:hypothetical protein